MTEGYVTEFTTALEAKVHLEKCGGGKEKIHLLVSREPIEDKDFIGYAFLQFEKEQLQEAKDKINEWVLNPDLVKVSGKINGKDIGKPEKAPEDVKESD